MGHKYRLYVILASAALAFHLFEGFSFINSAAATYDETVHLSSGYSYLYTGRYLMNVMDHPPFSEMLSALPLLALKPESFTTHPYYEQLRQYHYGDLFLYQNRVPPERLLNTARRFTFVIWTALLAWFIWLFASRLESAPAAGLSLAVFGLMPVFISNDALVTTDSASAVFYFGAFALAWLFTAVKPEERRGRGGRRETVLDFGKLRLWAVLAGSAAGLGMVSKFSLFIIPPLVVAFWIGDNLRWPRMKLSSLLGYAALYCAACLAVVLLVYQLDLALYWRGLYQTLTRLDEGRSSFVMGLHTLKGVWWYFPAALAVKTPLLVLFGGLAGLWLVIRNFRKDYLWLLLPPAVYFAAALNTKVQIGYRHIMPVMPFLAVLAGIALARLLAVKRGAWLVCGLLALTAASVGRAHPFDLAYFNELAGGPANGYKLFVDSNLDWGQDVKGVAEYLKTLGNPPVIFSYFGTARPESYGINYTPLGVISNVEMTGTGAQVCSMKDILLAVSATNLQGTYYPDKESFTWLKTRKPVFVAGYAIFVYDLTGDKDGLARLAALFDREGRNAEADCLYARAGKQEGI
jgi:4-amino-4-deoxy-L-arabinose transferase-like glycosyltransferase